MNPRCRNESGNTADDIARATGQGFLLRGGINPEYEEAVPEWEQGIRQANVAPPAGGGGGVPPPESGGAPFVAAGVDPGALDGPQYAVAEGEYPPYVG